MQKTLIIHIDESKGDYHDATNKVKPMAFLVSVPEKVANPSELNFDPAWKVEFKSVVGSDVKVTWSFDSSYTGKPHQFVLWPLSSTSRLPNDIKPFSFLSYQRMCETQRTKAESKLKDGNPDEAGAIVRSVEQICQRAPRDRVSDDISLSAVLPDGTVAPHLLHAFLMKLSGIADDTAILSAAPTEEQRDALRGYQSLWLLAAMNNAGADAVSYAKAERYAVEVDGKKPGSYPRARLSDALSRFFASADLWSNHANEHLLKPRLKRVGLLTGDANAFVTGDAKKIYSGTWTTICKYLADETVREEIADHVKKGLPKNISEKYRVDASAALKTWKVTLDNDAAMLDPVGIENLLFAFHKLFL